MRVHMISNSRSDQTTGRLFAELEKTMGEHGHQAELVLQSLPRGLRAKLLPMFLANLNGILRLRKNDALVVHSALALSFPVIVAARLFRRSVLAFVWDLYPESTVRATGRRGPRIWLFWLLERACYRLATTIVVPSDDYQPYLAGHQNKVLVVPLWPCDPLMVPVDPPSRGRPLRVAFAGQINAIRGIVGAVAQLESLSSSLPIELHIYSRDPWPPGHAGREARVRVTEHGFLSPEALSHELSTMHFGLVALDSSFDLPAFPSKVVAYTAAGLPVLYVGPRMPGLQRVLDHYRLGTSLDVGRLSVQELQNLHSDFPSGRTRYLEDMRARWERVATLL